MFRLNMLLPSSIYPEDLTTMIVRCSETLAAIYQTIWPYVLQDTKSSYSASVIRILIVFPISAPRSYTVYRWVSFLMSLVYSKTM